MKAQDCKTNLVIPAAGFSTRMGTCKMFLPLSNGKSFLNHLLEQARLFPFDKIVIVTQQKQIEKVKECIPEGMENTVKTIINPFPQKERFYSVQSGIASSLTADYCFIHNSDNPFLPLDVLNMLFEKRNEADCILPRYKSKGGHPVLINRKVMTDIVSRNENEKLNEILSGYRRFSVEVTNKLILTDIDTREEYENVLLNETILI